MGEQCFLAFRRPVKLLATVLLASHALQGAVAEEGLKLDADGAALIVGLLKRNESEVASSGEGKKPVSTEMLASCVPKLAGGGFVPTLRTAIDLIMQKRAKKVRRGLFHVSSALIALLGETQNACGGKAAELKDSLEDLATIAQRLRDLTDKKGHVEYKPLEKLLVGGVDIHKILNKFIGSWKKEPAMETDVGEQLGALIRAFGPQVGDGASAKAEL